MITNKHLDEPLMTWGANAGEAAVAVLAVHGRGQGPEFMRDESRRLKSVGLRFYAPAAPGSSWYPKPFLEPMESNEPFLSRALDVIGLHLASLEEAGFTQDRIVLWGFSQGACLLSHFALTRPAKYAGLILFTGGFIGPGALQVPVGRPLEGLQAVIRSTEGDAWVPAARVRETTAMLSAAGAATDSYIAPGDKHIITDEAVNAASAMLGKITVGVSDFSRGHLPGSTDAPDGILHLK